MVALIQPADRQFTPVASLNTQMNPQVVIVAGILSPLIICPTEAPTALLLPAKYRMSLPLQPSLLNFLLLASIRLRRLLHFLYVTGSHTHVFLPYLIRWIANRYLVLLEQCGLKFDYKIIFPDNTRSAEHTKQLQYKQYRFVLTPEATVLSIMLQPVQPANKGSLTRGGVRYSRRLGQRR